MVKIIIIIIKCIRIKAKKGLSACVLEKMKVKKRHAEIKMKEGEGQS